MTVEWRHLCDDLFCLMPIDDIVACLILCTDEKIRNCCKNIQPLERVDSRIELSFSSAEVFYFVFRSAKTLLKLHQVSKTSAKFQHPNNSSQEWFRSVQYLKLVWSPIITYLIGDLVKWSASQPIGWQIQQNRRWFLSALTCCRNQTEVARSLKTS